MVDNNFLNIIHNTDRTYYIYGHYLDDKCFYIGSNYRDGNQERAYNLSNRNELYKKYTCGRKQDIEVKLLKEFRDLPINNKNSNLVLSEEIKMIAHFHDLGEAQCSRQDFRGDRNPMFGKTHTKEVRNKLAKLRRENVGWHHSEETKKKMSLAALGPNNSQYGKPGAMLGKHHTDDVKELLSVKLTEYYSNNKIIWVNNGTISKRIKESDLYKYSGFTLGRLNFSRRRKKTYDR